MHLIHALPFRCATQGVHRFDEIAQLERELCKGFLEEAYNSTKHASGSTNTTLSMQPLIHNRLQNRPDEHLRHQTRGD